MGSDSKLNKRPDSFSLFDPREFFPSRQFKSDDSCKKVAVDLSGYINKPKCIKYIPGGHIYSNSVRVQIIAFKNRKQFFFQIGQREIKKFCGG